jgi:TonB family protein
MRLSVASAALAAAFVLTPVAAGYSPARSQDFSITNQVEPADAGRRDLMRQLQAWWDVHAYYPKAASQSDQGGTVKVHLVIHPDGNIWMVDVVESSGSRALDKAATLAFRGGFVRPFPAAQAASEAAIDIFLHYVLAHRHDEPLAAGYTPASSRSRFTISNDPVKSTVVDTMLQRTCTGIVVKEGLRNHPIYGWRSEAKAIFFRKPDGTPWVKFWGTGFVTVVPVNEAGNVAQWTTGPEYIARHTQYTRYTVWPDGDNRLTGNIGDPRGTVDLTCATEVVPAITSNAALETPPPAWPQAELRE